ncbi:DUF3108 domain-containing protein, partial [Malonomonas rubra]|uniref:DUF3108 domain-containing protein n=1 Tax=Malonomonas rubra TaxID=57040 RepID=UPI0026EA64EB
APVTQAPVTQAPAAQAPAAQAPAAQALAAQAPAAQALAETAYLPAGNERLEYEVGFLWFDRLADGSLELERFADAGHFRAKLEVKTRGMAALFTRNRRERYEAHFVLGSDGYFHSRSFVTRRFKGKGDSLTDRGKALFFDAEAGEVLFQRSENGRLTEEIRRELPQQHEVFDFLSAYWNLRLGMFGPLIPGTRMVIPSYTFKGAAEIVVEVLSPEEQRDLSFFPEGGTLCRLYLDEEVFQTGGGKLYVWFNDKRQVGSAIAVDVLGLGDVRGAMTQAKSFEAPPLQLEERQRPIHIEAAPFEP